jgi:hypothetical protein
MAKRRRIKTDKCLFCDRLDLSKTHIWPDWLERLLRPGTMSIEEETRPDKRRRPLTLRYTPRMGSPFSQKPYLACINCNTGWMQDVEDAMLKFAKPLFTSLDPAILNRYQIRAFVFWITLITVLAEYLDRSRSRVTITKTERDLIRRYRAPPPNWSIVVSSLNSEMWRCKYRNVHKMIFDFQNVGEYLNLKSTYVPNTQISSFGMGNIFVQVFSCPNERFVDDFRRAAKARGLMRLWPLPSGFWPFTEGTAKFPTKLVLDDDTAEIVADAFSERIDALISTPPHLSGSVDWRP